MCVIDTAAYYGVLTLMTVFLHSDLGWSDQRSGVTVSVFTMLVTLFMLGVGSYAERFGLRRAILFALLLTLGGRALYTLSPNLGSGVSVAQIVLAALVITAMGCSIIQPVCYSGVKQYTDGNTNSMGYSLIADEASTCNWLIGDPFRPYMKHLFSSRNRTSSLNKHHFIGEQ